MTVLLRFAPSPTGALHLGGLRTALYNHLLAKKHGGQWILRIEDTDGSRYVPGAVDNIRSALNWAGLYYDFGPGLDGPHGPYFQSKRLDLYRSYAHRLLESGHAYRCFCSADKLTATRERLARAGSNATYDQACLHLTEEEVARRVRAGEKFIIRLNDDRVPERIPPRDIVFGDLRDAHASLPTDPVLLKSDLFPTYHLSSVVDDHEMGISHVVRGEEWLPSLPLHLDLYSCLSLKPPQFAHLPLLLNPDGSKMSKRTSSVAILEFMKRGWEPEALVNWLALTGWGQARRSPLDTTATATRSPESTAILTLPELIEQFDLASLTSRRQSLEPAKLEYFNKHHLMRSWKSEQGTLYHAHRIHDLARASFPASQYTTPEYIAQVIHVLQGRITNIHDVPSLAPYFFVDPNYSTPEAQLMSKSLSSDDYRHALEVTLSRLQTEPDMSSVSDLSSLLHAACDVSGLKQKVFMTALRHALSAMKTGPTIPETITVLGLERTITRLKNALVNGHTA